MQKKKKGFTLVELLVVIAILAILASVSVVGYLSFTKKAQESNDVSLTDQMNTVLQANEALDKADTLGEAINQIKEDGGVDLELITPNSKGYNYAWEKKQNRILLLNESNEVVAPANLKDEATEDTVIIVKTKEQLEKAVNANYGVGIASSYTEDITTFNLLKEVSLDNYAGKIKTLNVKSTAPATYSLERNTNSNVYYSGVFENITLDESNGVTVYGKATTLDVKKNTGITIAANINKVVVSEGNVNVVEKAVVDFVDASKASNSSKVTINKSATAVVGGVQAPVGNVNAIGGNVGNVVVDKAPVTDFVGGLGTETSPYLIQTVDQFKKINSYSATYHYYKLTSDLTFNIGVGDSKIINRTLNGSLDGNSHKVEINYDSVNVDTICLFETTPYKSGTNPITVELKNLNVHFNPTKNIPNGGCSIVYDAFSSNCTSDRYKDTLIFNNVDTYGNMNFDVDGNNVAPYATYIQGNGQFIDCDSYVNITTLNYNSAFLGYIYGNTRKLSFANCSYNGHMFGKNVGLLIGNLNAFNSTLTSLDVTNLVINGDLSYFGDEGLSRIVGAMKSSSDEATISKIESKINSNKIQRLANYDGLNLEIDPTTKEISILNTGDTSKIKYYRLSLSMYATMNTHRDGTLSGKGGTILVAISKEFTTTGKTGLFNTGAKQKKTFGDTYFDGKGNKVNLEHALTDDQYTIIDKNASDLFSSINYNDQTYYLLKENIIDSTYMAIITSGKFSVTLYAYDHNDRIIGYITK